jgi:hypothetical protein
MDCRVKPGNDAIGGRDKTKMAGAGPAISKSYMGLNG